jgi:uncharacterized RDD family membrane protein YckC
VAEQARVDTAEPYPGQRSGLPATGAGSLASWRARIAALLLDWALSMALAVAVFGAPVIIGHGWQAWMTLTIFFLESALLSMTIGGSFGQVLCRIAVVRLDRRPLGLPRAVGRAVLVSLALPPIVVGIDRRGLQDLAAGTVVVNRR